VALTHVTRFAVAAIDLPDGSGALLCPTYGFVCCVSTVKTSAQDCELEGGAVVALVDAWICDGSGVNGELLTGSRLIALWANAVGT